MKIFLNLLSAYSGGQITRAKEFLNIIQEDNSIEVVILKEFDSLKDLKSETNFKVVNKNSIHGPFRAFKRMVWENLNISPMMNDHNSEIYLTFSHYLPKSISDNFHSIVGVSNLAPFSREAWEAENFLSRIRLFLLKRTILSSCKRATKVLALSMTCKNLLEEHGIEQEKILVASNGVSEFWGKPSHKDYIKELGIHAPSILYVSHFYFYKNFKNLILAYNKLNKLIKNKYQLILVGDPLDRACFEEVKKLVIRLKLEDNVMIYQGLEREKLRNLYQKTHLFVFASLIENSPNILLEAMKSGSPVLSTNLQPMPEFCGDSAEYFDGKNIDELTIKIQELLENDDKRSGMIQKSKEQAKKFTWETFTKKILKEFDSIHS